MISLLDLLKEEQALIYRGLIRVSYAQEANVTDIADAIRALEGVTIVTSVSNDEEANVVVYKIKVRSIDSGTGGGINAFKAIRAQGIKHSEILKVEIGTQSIERVR